MDLHAAAVAGDVQRVTLLLQQGAEVDALDRRENTPLLLACFNEVHHPEVIALLREHGADPHRRNIHWDTPRSRAYARYLLSGVDPLADLPAPEPPATDAADLTPAELAVVAAAVRAVVDHDRSALEAMKAYNGGDPYEWTREYGDWPAVHLVLPPGDPSTWTMHVIRGDDGDWLRVGVEMWTREEGRSDLTLELELHAHSDGRLGAEFSNLHVM